MQPILLLKMALFFSSLGVCITNIILLIAQSHLSIAQAGSSCKCLDMCTPMYTTLTFIIEALPSCYLCTAMLNEC